MSLNKGAKPWASINEATAPFIEHCQSKTDIIPRPSGTRTGQNTQDATFVDLVNLDKPLSPATVDLHKAAELAKLVAPQGLNDLREAVSDESVAAYAFSRDTDWQREVEKHEKGMAREVANAYGITTRSTKRKR
jgi:hypothetical protein